MGRRKLRDSGSVCLLAAMVLFAGCDTADENGSELAGSGEDQIDVPAEPPGTRGADVNREIFEEKLQFAREEGLDTLPIGDIMVRIGRTFLGTTYTPGTLDPAGPERLVIDLDDLDCVTYVENVLAISRLIQSGDTAFHAFQRELQRIRYRGGEMEGYPSRLHYFSEWISDNEDLGLLRNITAELGGVRDPEPIHFMSDNVEAYRQLEEEENLRRIREMEERLSEAERYYIPEEEVAGVSGRIRDGDIIAATSTLDGLDVAHTGLAIHVDGRLHLMHAPLVGEAVQISEQPLADRLLGIESQDGIMVARPL